MTLAFWSISRRVSDAIRNEKGSVRVAGRFYVFDAERLRGENLPKNDEAFLKNRSKGLEARWHNSLRIIMRRLTGKWKVLHIMASAMNSMMKPIPGKDIIRERFSSQIAMINMG